MKNIIFDLDGTLVDSMPMWSGVGKSFLEENGVVPPDNIDEIFKSMSFSESHAYFVSELGLKCSFEFMLEAIIKKVKEYYINSVPLKPYVYEFLEKERKKGTKMCILTASEKEYVMPALKRLKIENFFCGVFTCTELGMSKTNGDIYSAVAEKIGGTSSDTVVFEDALHGIASAAQNGFYTIAVEDASAADDKENIIKTAGKYITSFRELLS